jgi:hypothetical protein
MESEAYQLGQKIGEFIAPFICLVPAAIALWFGIARARGGQWVWASLLIIAGLFFGLVGMVALF